MATYESIGSGLLVDRVRREAARYFRAHIPEQAAETIREIHARIPEYARPYDETYVHTARAGVEKALHHFVDLLEQRDASTSGWREVYQAIGAGEVREGRSLDALQAAIRVGARVGWRHIVMFAERESLSVEVIGALADALWAHLDDLAAASADGYAHAQAAEAGEIDRRRRRLLELLVADPAAPDEAVATAAAAARWTVPRRLAAVALEAGAGLGPVPIMSPDMLVGSDQIGLRVIVPDPDSPAQVRAITNALGQFRRACEPEGSYVRAAIGPAVPPSEAANSLRWARHGLDLAARGVIPSTNLVWCSEHLATLTIFQDEQLVAELVRCRLAPLGGIRDSQRDLLADTLLAWLELNMNANAVATRLHVHPQTVRRRLRQLDRLFGEQVHDGDVRFELEIALRAERAGRTERRNRPDDGVSRFSPTRPARSAKAPGSARPALMP